MDFIRSMQSRDRMIAAVAFSAGAISWKRLSTGPPRESTCLRPRKPDGKRRHQIGVAASLPSPNYANLLAKAESRFLKDIGGSPVPRPG